ncbi:MAG: peroxiredoxin [Patescibacteria group bacterium]|nr:MAG: peroxiredoxin [Patescibacteria group bacterium]GIW63182.1 MAG: peroxiredoxin [Patescibacteria group bacterium]
MKAIDFLLPDQDNNFHSLKDYNGKWVLLYFYPKDNTPGCTKEACGFRDSFEELKKHNVVVLGVSADSVSSHKKFAEKFKLNFPLLSDTSKEIIKKYEAWGKKRFMGREFEGILRISYLINPEGKVVKKYDKVKPEVHAKEVLDDINKFKSDKKD